MSKTQLYAENSQLERAWYRLFLTNRTFQQPNPLDWDSDWHNSKLPSEWEESFESFRQKHPQLAATLEQGSQFRESYLTEIEGLAASFQNKLSPNTKLAHAFWIDLESIIRSTSNTRLAPLLETEKPNFVSQYVVGQAQWASGVDPGQWKKTDTTLINLLGQGNRKAEFAERLLPNLKPQVTRPMQLWLENQQSTLKASLDNNTHIILSVLTEQFPKKSKWFLASDNGKGQWKKKRTRLQPQDVLLRNWKLNADGTLSPEDRPETRLVLQRNGIDKNQPLSVTDFTRAQMGFGALIFSSDADGTLQFLEWVSHQTKLTQSLLQQLPADTAKWDIAEMRDRALEFAQKFPSSIEEFRESSTLGKPVSGPVSTSLTALAWARMEKDPQYWINRAPFHVKEAPRFEQWAEGHRRYGRFARDLVLSSMLSAALVFPIYKIGAIDSQTYIDWREAQFRKLPKSHQQWLIERTIDGYNLISPYLSHKLKSDLKYRLLEDAQDMLEHREDVASEAQWLRENPDGLFSDSDIERLAQIFSKVNRPDVAKKLRDIVNSKDWPYYSSKQYAVESLMLELSEEKSEFIKNLAPEARNEMVNSMDSIIKKYNSDEGSTWALGRLSDQIATRKRGPSSGIWAFINARRDLRETWKRDTPHQLASKDSSKAELKAEGTNSDHSSTGNGAPKQLPPLDAPRSVWLHRWRPKGLVPVPDEGVNRNAILPPPPPPEWTRKLQPTKEALNELRKAQRELTLSLRDHKVAPSVANTRFAPLDAFRLNSVLMQYIEGEVGMEALQSEIDRFLGESSDLSSPEKLQAALIKIAQAESENIDLLLEQRLTKNKDIGKLNSVLGLRAKEVFEKIASHPWRKLPPAWQDKKGDCHTQLIKLYRAIP